MTKYILIPTMPTPNGPLHLGHIAGPYLKPDILARHLRQHGHSVAIVSGSDVWETHVLQKARSLGISPEAVCQQYHNEILNGMAALDIEYDAYINPLDDSYCGQLETVARGVFETLRAAGRLTYIEELVPYSLKYDQPVVGSSVAGTCPYCGDDDVGGFHCEACAREISPGDLIEIYSDLPDDVFVMRRFTSAFLKISSPERLLAELRKMVSDPALIDVAKAHLARNGNFVRLTHPGRWGINVKTMEVTEPAVLFSFPGLLAFSVLCGEIGNQILGSTVPPFSKGTEITAVNVFGFDNTIPFFLAVAGQALESEIWNPADYYLTNRFYTLNGQKFSTSREHAIWATDAKQRLRHHSDFIRLYLAKTSPEFGVADFSTTDFKNYADATASRTQQLLSQAFQHKAMRGSPDETIVLESLFENQSACLSLNAFRLQDSVLPLENWLDYGNDHEIGGFWAAGFALLAYPFMPRMAKAAWENCGYAGIPTLVELKEHVA